MPRYNSNVETNKKGVSIAGMSLGGGRKENFFFCLLEFYPNENRWFLKTLRQLKDEAPTPRDEAIMSWIKDYNLTELIVDFPLSKPLCDGCELQCPGINNCAHPVVTNIRNEIEQLLEMDEELILDNPKRYEQIRETENMVQHSKDLSVAPVKKTILSKAFKRKLRKGYLPYWNRPIDFWIWKNYYDQVLELFNISYDSFGNVSMMLLNRFKYLARHFPHNLKLFESSTYITLIELLNAKIITKKMLRELQDMNTAALARIDIIRAIEKKLQIFIYDKDLEDIVKNPKAFDSFLLAVAGKSLVMKSNRSLGEQISGDPSHFIAPDFTLKRT